MAAPHKRWHIIGPPAPGPACAPFCGDVQQRVRAQSCGEHTVHPATLSQCTAPIVVVHVTGEATLERACRRPWQQRPCAVSLSRCDARSLAGTSKAWWGTRRTIAALLELHTVMFMALIFLCTWWATSLPHGLHLQGEQPPPPENLAHFTLSRPRPPAPCPRPPVIPCLSYRRLHLKLVALAAAAGSVALSIVHWQALVALYAIPREAGVYNITSAPGSVGEIHSSLYGGDTRAWETVSVQV